MTRGTHAHSTSPCSDKRLRIVALVPAHNEEKDIANTIGSLIDQDRKLDGIFIISDNSSDNTVAIARQFPVIVIESQGLNCCPECTRKKKNTHRKSGGLNQVWDEYCHDVDLIVCVDGDATLPPHAVTDWEKEFIRNPNLGGSSSQPVLIGGEHWEMRPYTRPKGRTRPLHWTNDRVRAFFAGLIAWYLPRLQRFEFAKTINQSLNRGYVFVVSGVGCAYRNAALWDVARQPGQHGPWTYDSVVEDYHLTYQMRRAGWECKMSRTVWCYAGSMVTLKSLWYQRIKWTGGTDGDLLKFGCDRLNWRQWAQNAYLLSNILFWLVWVALEVPEMFTGTFHMNWWWQGIGLSFVGFELIHMARMSHPRYRRDWKDWLLVGLMVHLFVLTILSLSWGIVSWGKVLYSKLGDLWTAQYRAEGMTSETEDQKIGVS